jgi:hypothetical protein
MTSVFPGPTDVSKKSYITTEAPNGHIYSYAKTYDAGTYTWSGALTAISFGSSPYNVPGIVLRETGKKLYANANPGVDRYMVGVFIIDQDGNNVAGEIGSMFIDPNCSVFAQFNGQRPTYIPTSEDTEVGGLDFGNPVYTRGNITTTDGDVTASGNVTTTGGNFVASSTAAGTGSLLLGSGALAAGVNNAIAVGATATVDNQIITTGPINATTVNGTITAFGNIATTNGGITAALPIRCTTSSPLTISGSVASLNASLSQLFTVSSASNFTIDATNVNSVLGAYITILIKNTNVAGTINVVMGNNIRESSTISIGNNGSGYGYVASITFVAALFDGATALFEVSRSNTILPS